jgi:quinol monooxygenase YgiN
MTYVGFLVELEAKPDRVDDVADFLTEARRLVEAEPGTLLWFAFRRGPMSFAIFDVFADDAARQVHLHGEVRKELMRCGPEILAAEPIITPVDVTDWKVPEAFGW